MTQVEKINIKIIQSHTFKKRNVWRRITKSKTQGTKLYTINLLVNKTYLTILEIVLAIYVIDFFFVDKYVIDLKLFFLKKIIEIVSLI